MQLSGSRKDTKYQGDYYSLVFRNTKNEDEVTVYIKESDEGFTVETDTGAVVKYSEWSEMFEEAET